MGWIALTDQVPEDYDTVLAQHEDDLYPVVAFRMPDGVWWRTPEGPEDVAHEAMAPLFRAPTHWRPLPTSPRGEAMCRSIIAARRRASRGCLRDNLAPSPSRAGEPPAPSDAHGQPETATAAQRAAQSRRET